MFARALFALALSGFALASAACPLPNGYRFEQAFSNITFSGMVQVEPIPGDPGHALVLTQGGVIHRSSLVDASEASSVFLDLRDRLHPSPDDEEGLLGLAFAPDYATSGRFYVHYTAPGGEPSVRGLPGRVGRISRFTASGASATPSSEQVLLEVYQPYTNHNGGALAFGPDGMLYIALGDGGSGGDPHNYAQDRNSLLGKILRVDVSGPGGYTIPPDNPFAGGGGRPEIYAYGFRNPWRLSFDRETGQLWAADVGQSAWEEVDRVVAGGNYGWSQFEGDACFKQPCNAPGAIPPRITYSHQFGCSISGGHVYRGTAMPELRGWYVYGDFCSGRVWAVNTEGSGPAIPLADTGTAIVSFMQDGGGELYAVTFNNAVYRLVRK